MPSSNVISVLSLLTPLFIISLFMLKRSTFKIREFKYKWSLVSPFCYFHNHKTEFEKTSSLMQWGFLTLLPRGSLKIQFKSFPLFYIWQILK